MNPVKIERPLIEVSPVSSVDAGPIARVFKQTWIDTYPNVEYGITRRDIEERVDHFDTAETIERRQLYFDSLGADALALVARVRGEIVGICQARRADDNRIEAIYVLPKCQGLGVGAALILPALDWLDSERPMWVSVVSYNEKAIGFYRRFGFEKSHLHRPTKSAILPSGKVLPQIEMIRPPSSTADTENGRR